MRKSNNSYEKDFYQWTQIQASLLKKGEFEKVDLEHIIEEIETLGKSDKRALYGYCVVLLHHLLKNTFAPEKKGNSKSWDASIINSRNAIKRLLRDSPSLKKECEEILDEAYQEARQMAILETGDQKFPKDCPWSIKEILDGK